MPISLLSFLLAILLPIAFPRSQQSFPLTTDALSCPGAGAC